MTAAELARRRLRSHQGFYRLMGGVDLGDGVFAGICPGAPERSLPNAVTYTDGDAVLSRLAQLAAIYDEAGVRAWTVWVPEHDRPVAERLEAAGHHLDGTPTAMAAPLGAVDLDGPVPEEVGEATWEEVAELNDAAYGLPAGAFPAMLAHLDDGMGAARRYAVPGRACMVAIDHDGDCAIEFVATHPDHRGRGLASALLRHVLREAAQRGCRSTSLEATAAGRPLYERMGYRPLGTLQMWERRQR